MWKRLRVKYPLFLSDLNETWILSTDFRKTLKYQVSSKSVQWELSCSLRMEGREDRHKFKSADILLSEVNGTVPEFYCQLKLLYHMFHIQVRTSRGTGRFFLRCKPQEA
jgi:hypothetical protein